MKLFKKKNLSEEPIQTSSFQKSFGLQMGFWDLYSKIDKQKGVSISRENVKKIYERVLELAKVDILFDPAKEFYDTTLKVHMKEGTLIIYGYWHMKEEQSADQIVGARFYTYAEKDMLQKETELKESQAIESDKQYEDEKKSDHPTEQLDEDVQINAKNHVDEGTSVEAQDSHLEEENEQESSGENDGEQSLEEKNAEAIEQDIQEECAKNNEQYAEENHDESGAIEDESADESKATLVAKSEDDSLDKSEESSVDESTEGSAEKSEKNSEEKSRDELENKSEDGITNEVKSKNTTKGDLFRRLLDGLNGSTGLRETRRNT